VRKPVTGEARAGDAGVRADDEHSEARPVPDETATLGGFVVAALKTRRASPIIEDYYIRR